MVQYAMVIDLNRCMGCRACVEACKVENNTGRGIFWMHVFRREEGTYPNVRVRFMPRPCMHCDNAPCIKVCPVGARYKSENGIVLTDYDRCIGCRYCEVACPYGVNFFNWREPAENQYFKWREGEGENVYGSGDVRRLVDGSIAPYRNPTLEEPYEEEKRTVAGGGHYIGVIEKCTFCIHRVEKGLDPACVANCPAFVYTFGDLEDPNSKVSKILAEKRWFRLLDAVHTEPRVYYLGTSPIAEHHILMRDDVR